MRQKVRREMRWHRMPEEQQKGYRLAMRYGAKKTAAGIRAGKYSIGQALIRAEREIGVNKVFFALQKAREPMWSLAALRYLTMLDPKHHFWLRTTINTRALRHAKWALEKMSHLGEHETKMLKFILEQ